MNAARLDRALAFGLFAVTFTSLWVTEKDVGFTRDESVYFAAAEAHAGWFKQLAKDPATALSDSSIVAAWDFNHEHPALMKSLFALSFLVFHEGLATLRPATAFRVPAFLAAALIPALIYALGRRFYSRSAGFFGALAFVLVPRHFFHAHLACFDVPVATTWLLTVYAFLRAQEEARWWAYCGVAFGLAIATKHNALFLPFVLGPFALWQGFRQSSANPEARQLFLRSVGAFVGAAALFVLLGYVWGRARFQQQFLLLSPQVAIFLSLVVAEVLILRRLRDVHLGTFRAAAPVAAMAVLGPAVFYALWPYLWHAPVDRTAWYLDFHATHNHYAWFYFGRILREPPFPLAYVLVKTAFTVPLSLFVPMALGWLSWAGSSVLLLLGRLTRTFRAPTLAHTVVAVNAVASILVISHPEVPHFGGVKHWFPSMPFLCLLAGHSVARSSSLVAAWLSSRLPRANERTVSTVLFALLLLPALVATVRIHPYGTSYYSELPGGLPGAATLGFQRQFWSNNVTGVLPWLNQNAPAQARLYLHEVNGFSFRDYQRNGMLRPDLRPAGGPHDADLAVYQYHQEFREHEMNVWQAFAVTQPVHGLYVDETPQVVVYQRR